MSEVSLREFVELKAHVERIEQRLDWMDDELTKRIKRCEQNEKEFDDWRDSVIRSLASSDARHAFMTIVYSTIVALLVTGLAIYFRV